ncbi:MAG: MFS transporter [Candidatus Micrarchaeota archaeon]
MRKLAIVNFIESFFSSALAVALPLYLLHTGIDIEEIGIILSVSPLAFLVIRTLTAMAAEVLGTRIFFLATSLSQALSSLIYMFSSTPLLFGAGKFLEGAAYSFFWAVNRTKVIEREAAKETVLAKLISVRMLAATIGTGAAGIIISASFEALFQLLILAGLISFVTSLFFWRGRGREAKIKPAEMLNPKARGREFWKASFAIFFILAAFSALFSFLLPIYLRSGLGISYEGIGALMMFFYLAIALGSYSAIQLGMGGKLVLASQAATMPLIILIPLAPAYIFPILLLAGFGFGVSFAMQEKMLVRVTQDAKYLSTDVALLYVPGRIGEFATLAASGFVLALFGSAPLFALSALLMAGFIHLSRGVLGGK